MSGVPYTRAQVVAVERIAWAVRLASGGREYFYDGISFWWGPVLGENHAVREDEVPVDGWRHKDGCNCALCR